LPSCGSPAIYGRPGTEDRTRRRTLALEVSPLHEPSSSKRAELTGLPRTAALSGRLTTRLPDAGRWPRRLQHRSPRVKLTISS